MRLLFSILIVLMCTSLSAQDRTISGKVSDNLGPLPGVMIVIKGTQKGTTTDFDGNFSIKAKTGQTLKASFVGMKTVEKKIGANNTINITLQEDTSELDEIVVVGYGTKKATNVSGAISTVNEKAVENIKPVRMEDALQGQASGVNVISNPSPGEKPTVLIRGIPSYTGTDPLVVIDGVPQTLDDLNALNPSDIKQIDVLKDAASTAIYGVKGGNGVIVVTTKIGGKNQKTTFNLNSTYSIQEVYREIDVLNASQYAAILNEASMASGTGLEYPDISELGEGTNWQDEIFEQSPIMSHSFSATGGGDKTSYYFSTSFTGFDGVVGGGNKSFFDRFNVTGNIDTDVTDKFKIILNTSYANIKAARVPENSINGVVSNALNFDPTVPVRDANGAFGISDNITQEIINPVAQINNTYNKVNVNKVFGKLEFQYDLLENLKLNSRLGYTYAVVQGKSFLPLVYYGQGHNATNANEDLTQIVSTNTDGEETRTHNRVTESYNSYFSYTYEAFANYDFNINENHFFDIVAGMSIAAASGDGISATAEDVPFNSWKFADVSAATGADDTQRASSSQYIKRNLSYFGRVDYDYKEKYFASFTLRRDGSTSFGENNKFAFFPSGSLGWTISKEDFFNTNTIDFLKFRGSYGIVGNDNITPQFSNISTFPQYTFGGSIAQGSTLQTIPNANVGWENQIQFNVGFDLKMFDKKLSLTADYFNKTVDDLLFNPTLSLYLGEPVYPTANIGRASSKGFDITLGFNDEVNDDFNWNTSINFTTSTNMVEEINNGDKFIWGSSYGIPEQNITRYEEGYSPGFFYGYVTDGIFQNMDEVNSHATQNFAQPGDIRFKDINDDGKIDDKDRTQIGDPFPDFTFGWNLGFEYKGFDLNVFTYGSIGQDIFRAYERNLSHTNKFSRILNRWTGEGTSNTEPRVGFVDQNNNTRASDRYVEDGSFVRIKNIQLGYTISEEVSEKFGFQQVRLYGQIKNAYTFTDYSGFDPEISSGVLDTGVDRGTYPMPRIWALGINLKF